MKNIPFLVITLWILFSKTIFAQPDQRDLICYDPIAGTETRYTYDDNFTPPQYYTYGNIGIGQIFQTDFLDFLADFRQKRSKSSTDSLAGIENFSNYMKVQNPTSFPWRLNCLVISEFIIDGKAERWQGSGALIDSKHLLTAAHIIRQKRHWPSRLVVIPASNNFSTPFGVAFAVRFYTFSGYIDWDEPPKYDIAIVELDWPIGSLCGWLGIETFQEKCHEYLGELICKPDFNYLENQYTFVAYPYKGFEYEPYIMRFREGTYDWFSDKTLMEDGRTIWLSLSYDKKENPGASGGASFYFNSKIQQYLIHAIGAYMDFNIFDGWASRGPRIDEVKFSQIVQLIERNTPNKPTFYIVGLNSAHNSLEAGKNILANIYVTNYSSVSSNEQISISLFLLNEQQISNIKKVTYDRNSINKQFFGNSQDIYLGTSVVKINIEPKETKLLSIGENGEYLIPCKITPGVYYLKAILNGEKNDSPIYKKVTIKGDETPPDLSCPSNLTVNCGCDVENLEITGTATAIDICDPNPEVLYSDLMIPGLLKNTIYRTWTTTDNSNNSATGIQVINEVGCNLLGVDDENGHIIKIDLKTEPNQIEILGTLIYNSILLKDLEAMTWDPVEGHILVISKMDDGSLYKIDPTKIPYKKSLANIPAILVGRSYSYIEGIAVNPVTGQLFGVDNRLHKLVLINKSNAQVTIVGDLRFNDVEGLAFTLDTNPTLYGADSKSGKLITIDTKTGNGTPVHPYNCLNFPNVECLEFSPDGTLYGFSDGPNRNSKLFITIDPASGIGTKFMGCGNIILDIEGLTFGLPLVLSDQKITFKSNITEDYVNVPQNFSLYQNYPNPFNASTIIRYSISESSDIRLVIYNTLGQKIRTLISTYKNPGDYTVEWDGKDDQGISVPSGLYLYKLQADNFVQMKKMLLMR